MLRKQETTTSTSIADFHNTITINDDSITMIAQPESMFKLLRALNHWIDNLIKHHPSEDTVNTKQQWYIKWKAIYPYIHSSKRQYLDVYHMITNDYAATVETATVYKLIDYFITEFPQFKEQYDIKPVKHRKNDHNYFTFTLNLYFSGYNDKNNSFNKLETNSYIPFTNNNSVMTWKTAHSISSSVASIQSNPIPQVVHTDNTPDNIKDNNTLSPKDLSDDTNISYSPNPPSEDIKMEKPSVCLQRNIKRTEDLKQLVSNTCKNEIKSEMATICDEMVKFKSSIEISLTDNHLMKQDQQVNNTAVPNVIPSMYHTSMPSPRHTPKISNSIPTDDTEQYNSPTDIPNNAYRPRDKPYQRSGTLSFV
jgi:hypothetical protein